LLICFFFNYQSKAMERNRRYAAYKKQCESMSNVGNTDAKKAMLAGKSLKPKQQQVGAGSINVGEISEEKVKTALTLLRTKRKLGSEARTWHYMADVIAERLNDDQATIECSGKKYTVADSINELINNKNIANYMIKFVRHMIQKAAKEHKAEIYWPKTIGEINYSFLIE